MVASMMPARRAVVLTHSHAWQRGACTTVALVAATCFARPLHAEVVEKSKKVAGVIVYYKVVLPAGYDPAKTYPGILALGGGPQTMNTVDAVLSRNLRAEAEQRG